MLLQIIAWYCAISIVIAILFMIGSWHELKQFPPDQRWWVALSSTIIVAFVWPLLFWVERNRNKKE